jgi:hypothetical protein
VKIIKNSGYKGVFMEKEDRVVLRYPESKSKCSRRKGIIIRAFVSAGFTVTTEGENVFFLTENGTQIEDKMSLRAFFNPAWIEVLKKSGITVEMSWETA